MNKLEYYDRQKDEWSTSETYQIISEYNTDEEEPEEVVLVETKEITRKTRSRMK